MDEQAQARPLPERKSYRYLDVLRCVCVYMVIICHCCGFVEQDPSLVGTRLWWFSNCVNILGHVGVSIYFMISGFLLLSDPRTLNVGQFYRRRLCKLLPPFLIWNVAYYLLTCAENHRLPDVDAFIREFANQGSAVHLWYVYQIIGLYLLMPFLKRIVDHCTTKELVVLLGVVLLQPTFMRFINLTQDYVWLAPFQALMEGYVGFLLLGYLLGWQELEPKARAWVYALGVFGLAFGMAGNYNSSKDGIVNLPYNEGYAITQFLISAALFLLAKQADGKLPAAVRRWAGKIQPLTYGIYLSHIFVLRRCLYAAEQGWGSLLTTAQHILVRFLVTAVGSTALNWFFSRVPVLKKYLL